MATEYLRASEAARRLQIPTKELLRLIHQRAIRYVMVDGIAHVPVDAVYEYRTKAS
jgi:excisionase family DNA binding protein